MRVEVVSKDMGVGENGAKAQVALAYSLTRPKIKLQKRRLWIRDHVGEKALNSNLLPKFGHAKKIPPTSFPNHLLEKAWVEFAFPYAPLPRHDGAKWNTIGVITKASAKLPHHRGLALVYTMENETPFIHHVVEWQGCDYTIEDDENLNERTKRDPKMKPKSKLMQAGWKQGKVLS